MANGLILLLWLGWAVFSAWSIRVGLVMLLFHKFGGWAYPMAYFCWLALFAAAFWFLGWCGSDMYGGDPNDPWQRAGWIIFLLSPIGLPVCFGAPIVLVTDAIFIWFSVERR